MREVTEAEVQANFIRIRQEIKKLVADELKRISRDPGLEGNVVKG